MAKQLIAFDLDDTLAITKSPITDRMSELLSELLVHYKVCVISGGKVEQFLSQVVDNLKVGHSQLLNMHLLPTCGTTYYRFSDIEGQWKQIYNEVIAKKDKQKITKLLLETATELGYLEDKTYGEIVEDRDSQVTFSGCGQLASPEVKYKWDPDQKKRKAIQQKIAPELPDFEVRIGDTTSIDVTTIGIDKAYGMEKIMQTLEMGKSDILFVGDKLQEGGNDYPVKAMGIDCLEVSRWEETALVIETILKMN